MSRDRNPPRRSEYDSPIAFLQGHDAWLNEPNRRRLGDTALAERTEALEEIAALATSLDGHQQYIRIEALKCAVQVPDPDVLAWAAKFEAWITSGATPAI